MKQIIIVPQLSSSNSEYYWQRDTKKLTILVKCGRQNSNPLIDLHILKPSEYVTLHGKMGIKITPWGH